MPNAVDESAEKPPARFSTSSGSPRLRGMRALVGSAPDGAADPTAPTARWRAKCDCELGPSSTSEQPNPPPCSGQTYHPQLEGAVAMHRSGRSSRPSQAQVLPEPIGEVAANSIARTSGNPRSRGHAWVSYPSTMPTSIAPRCDSVPDGPMAHEEHLSGPLKKRV
ncbi:hypothetical protein VFPFJ_05847 [Purpureocillium lilacinum]|uniref:Uncharacterized protein n=1 Tax=Purpureocillium lilacinum TaxID=33203 RepID=A0A179HII8_PURLI|nr:hypothetical protein VFPFJ_05847 [Purpureocillium lilacinum]OAQ89438.1 hypothetical protein VFPFJ_05847 [Purpureocillium lilacinum]